MSTPKKSARVLQTEAKIKKLRADAVLAAQEANKVAASKWPLEEQYRKKRHAVTASVEAEIKKAREKGNVVRAKIKGQEARALKPIKNKTKALRAKEVKLKTQASALETKLAQLEVAETLARLRKDARYSGAKKLTLTYDLPRNQAFIGFKYVDYVPGNRTTGHNRSGQAVLALLIPNDAKSVAPHQSGDYKCRASKALCLGVIKTKKDCSTDIAYTKKCKLFSWWDHSFEYKVGQTAIPDSFDGDKHTHCSHGINFYPTLEQVRKMSSI